MRARLIKDEEVAAPMNIEKLCHRWTMRSYNMWDECWMKVADEIRANYMFLKKLGSAFPNKVMG